MYNAANSCYQWITSPFGYTKIKRYNKTADFNVLDVGAGNHSATKFHKFFKCNYYGLDISKNYNNDSRDFELMTDFYELDLTTLDYKTVPDCFFDVIYFSHVIEHLYNGDFVLENLLPKLKPGGVFYLEYPSIRSIRFPSMSGTLNFYDDSTHVRLYAMHELLNIFTRNNFVILDKGVRRRLAYILIMPVRIIMNLIRRPKSTGYASVFWDLFGFAEFIVAGKRNTK